jgi:hypothetical protein
VEFRGQQRSDFFILRGTRDNVAVRHDVLDHRGQLERQMHHRDRRSQSQVRGKGSCVVYILFILVRIAIVSHSILVSIMWQRAALSTCIWKIAMIRGPDALYGMTT